MKHQQGDSIKSFEDWLKWAKDFVLTEQKMKDIWPTTWSETEDILKRVGYESPKHYYIITFDNMQGNGTLWNLLQRNHWDSFTPFDTSGGQG